MSGFTHEKPVPESYNWLTPVEYLKALTYVDGPFGLDPCAAPDPRPWPTAQVHFDHTQGVDGLGTEWARNLEVWLNPPYGPHTGKWLKKLADHGNGMALVFARTDAQWFHDHAEGCSFVYFLKRRIRFRGPDGQLPRDKNGKLKTGPGSGSMILGWGYRGLVRIHNARKMDPKRFEGMFGRFW